MIIGHIYINGVIGSSEDARGVELQDVVMQVQANKDADILHFHINSPGGSVNTGRLIAEYISKLPNAVTIAKNLCGSIATEIHLSVPLAKRKIIAGTEYFIHNPLLVDVTGNADELAEASAYVKTFEKEMINMYVKNTTADKSAIEGLMKAETSLTDEQCVALGFVSEVLQKEELKAVAFFDKKKEAKSNKIDIKKSIENMEKSILDKVKAIVKDAITPTEAKAMMVTTDNGELSYASEGELPEVGEAVMIGEEIAPEGSYVTDNGTVINVDAEGVVLEVIEVEEEETVEALKAKIVEMEANHEVEKTEMLEAFKNEVNENIAESVEAKVKEELAKTGSEYTPKGEKKVFSKKKEKPTLSMKEKVAALKAEREEKKN